MTAALLIGLPLNFFKTVTSMWEVAGGALYFRPCLSGESCAPAGRQAMGAAKRRRASGDQRMRRNDMWTFYDFWGEFAVSWQRHVGLTRDGQQGGGREGLRDFHSDFTFGI